MSETEPSLRPARIPWPAAAGAGVLAAASAMLFFLAFDEPFTLRGDNKLVHFPMKLEAFRQWGAGIVPQWSSGLWLGFGLLGDATTGVFYLPHAPALWLTPDPHLRAFDLATAMHVGLLVAGSVALLRRLGCGLAACAVGAVAMPLAGQLLGWTAYLPGFSAICWWPWVLVAADGLLEAGAGARETLVASIPIAAQVFAGYPEAGLYSGVLAAGWVTCASGALPPGRRLLRTAGLALSSAALSGPQLVPGAIAVLDTIRGSALDVRGTLRLQGGWLDVVDPRVGADQMTVLDPFLGAATLLLCAIAVARGAPRARVLAGALVLGFLAALGDATPVYRLLSQLPLFDLFRGPHKYFLVAQLSALWLAALGVDALLRTGRPTRERVAGALLALAMLGEHAFAFTGHLPRVTRGHTPREVEVSDAMALLEPIATRLREDRAHDPVPQRVSLGRWLRGLGSFPLVLGIEGARGGGVALLPRTHDWMRKPMLGRPQLDSLGVGYAIDERACPVGEPPEARDSQGACVRKRTAAAPRLELASRVRPAGSLETMIREMASGSDREGVALLASTRALPRATPGAPATLELVSRSPGRYALAIDAPTPRVLLVRESWSAGWSARVDGADAPVHRADGVFFAVGVPEGRHDVTLRFRQPGLAAGLSLAIGWLGLLIALVLAARGTPGGGTARGDQPETTA